MSVVGKWSSISATAEQLFVLLQDYLDWFCQCDQQCGVSSAEKDVCNVEHRLTLENTKHTSHYQ